MMSFITVVAETPNGQSQEYVWVGDENDIYALKSFMRSCKRDCADRFECPDDWDCDEWYAQTIVAYYKEDIK